MSCGAPRFNWIVWGMLLTISNDEAENWPKLKGQKIMRSILKFSISVAALVALLTLSTPVHAQVAARSGEVSGNVGFSNLNGIDNKKHIAFGGSGAYNLSDWTAIGFEYNYQLMGSKAEFHGTNTTGHLQTYGLLVRISMTKSRRVDPYALIAAGGATVTAVASNQYATESGSQHGFYGGFGGGVSFFAGHNWGIRPEVRFERQHYMATTIDGIPAPSSNLSYVLGTVSVFYQFGGKH